MSGERVARRVVVRGVVQGVGFRDFVRRRAGEAGVEGTVRNCRDGSVEALLGGPAQAVEQVVDQMRRGPASARVDDVEVTEVDAGSVGGGFRVTH